MMRKLMRNVRRTLGARTMGSAPAVGSHRAGMHQAAEHEYQRSRMAEAAEPVEETAEDALDMPAAVEEEIPPVEEDDDQIVADIAEGEAAAAPEEEILEEVADPESAQNEEEAEVPAEISEETLGTRGKGPGARDRMAVDWSGERVPVLDYSVTGSSDPETELVYSSGDGSVKEIQEPLPMMQALYGVQPYMPGVEDPSANVADHEEPEPAPEPDPEPEPGE